jgi:acetoin:2,6-dichlorophenolindophenol oxidoreductase subunit beta
LSPLDESTILESVSRTHRLVVVDEDTPRCGMASDVVSLVARKAFGELHAAPQMVTPPHTPVPYSPPMEDFYIPSVQKIADAIRATLKSSRTA